MAIKLILNENIAKMVIFLLKIGYTVPIVYSNLGYSGRASYSDLKPCDEPPSVHK